MKDQSYPITIESGRLLGSVRVVGELPDPMLNSEVEKFIEGLRIIAGLHELEAAGTLILNLRGQKL